MRESYQLVLLVDEVLALNEHREQGRRRLQLLPEREHLLVHEDGEAEVEGRGDTRDEVEGGELAGQLLHGEDHLVHLPLEAIVQVELVEEVHDVGVRAEEDVQARLDPVPVLVLPGADLAAELRARLVDHGRVPRVGQVFGAREAREPAPDNGHLLARLPRLQLQVAAHEPLREGVRLAVGVRVLDVGLREVPRRRCYSAGRAAAPTTSTPPAAAAAAVVLPKRRPRGGQRRSREERGGAGR